MSFRDNLQHLRASRKMTQEQLAMLLGVSRQSVTKWEAEKSYPEMDKLLKICQIFECSLDDLVTGDLTSCAPAPDALVPAGPPTDVCGYDDHQRMMARKIPTGIASILVGVAVGLLLDGPLPAASWSGSDVALVVSILAGVLTGLAFMVPAGMEHTAFVRAHPYVEDFYTEEDRAVARRQFSYGLLGGIAAIFAGVGLLLALDERAENLALFLMMLCIALGVWLIVRFDMLYERTKVAKYNDDVTDELEVEDIVNAELDDARREALLAKKERDRQLEAACGAIMIVATIVGLLLLFVPALSASDPSSFDAMGTPAEWFWVAWPIGGLLCGLVCVLWDGFSRR